MAKSPKTRLQKLRDQASKVPPTLLGGPPPKKTRQSKVNSGPTGPNLGSSTPLSPPEDVIVNAKGGQTPAVLPSRPISAQVPYQGIDQAMGHGTQGQITIKKSVPPTTFKRPLSSASSKVQTQQGTADPAREAKAKQKLISEFFGSEPKKIQRIPKPDFSDAIKAATTRLRAEQKTNIVEKDLELSESSESESESDQSEISVESKSGTMDSTETNEGSAGVVQVSVESTSRTMDSEETSEGASGLGDVASDKQGSSGGLLNIRRDKISECAQLIRAFGDANDDKSSWQHSQKLWNFLMQNSANFANLFEIDQAGAAENGRTSRDQTNDNEAVTRVVPNTELENGTKSRHGPNSIDHKQNEIGTQRKLENLPKVSPGLEDDPPVESRVPTGLGQSPEPATAEPATAVGQVISRGGISMPSILPPVPGGRNFTQGIHSSNDNSTSTDGSAKVAQLNNSADQNADEGKGGATSSSGAPEQKNFSNIAALQDHRKSNQVEKSVSKDLGQHDTIRTRVVQSPVSTGNKHSNLSESGVIQKIGSGNDKTIGTTNWQQKPQESVGPQGIIGHQGNSRKPPTSGPGFLYSNKRQAGLPAKERIFGDPNVRGSGAAQALSRGNVSKVDIRDENGQTLAVQPQGGGGSSQVRPKGGSRERPSGSQERPGGGSQGQQVSQSSTSRGKSSFRAESPKRDIGPPQSPGGLSDTLSISTPQNLFPNDDVMDDGDCDNNPIIDGRNGCHPRHQFQRDQTREKLKCGKVLDKTTRVDKHQTGYACRSMASFQGFKFIGEQHNSGNSSNNTFSHHRDIVLSMGEIEEYVPYDGSVSLTRVRDPYGQPIPGHFILRRSPCKRAISCGTEDECWKFQCQPTMPSKSNISKNGFKSRGKRGGAKRTKRDPDEPNTQN